MGLADGIAWESEYGYKNNSVKVKPIDYTQLSNKELIEKTLHYLDNITSIKRTATPLTYEEVLVNLVIYEFVDRLQNIKEVGND